MVKRSRRFPPNAKPAWTLLVNDELLGQDNHAEPLAVHLPAAHSGSLQVSMQGLRSYRRDRRARRERPRVAPPEAYLA